MIMVDGSMRPPMVFDPHPVGGGDYEGQGSAQWTSSFDGDQFIEVDVGRDVQDRWFSTASTTPCSSCTAKATGSTGRVSVANIDYLPDFGDDTTTIYWYLTQEARNGESIAYTPGVDGEIIGHDRLR